LEERSYRLIAAAAAVVRWRPDDENKHTRKRKRGCIFLTQLFSDAFLKLFFFEKKHVEQI
jgi:hypothetical protein